MKRKKMPERLAEILAEAEARAAALRKQQDARNAKGSAGLPPTVLRGIRTGSVATRSRRTTTGRHHAR